jgi:hypothetical protein
MQGTWVYAGSVVPGSAPINGTLIYGNAMAYLVCSIYTFLLEALASNNCKRLEKATCAIFPNSVRLTGSNRNGNGACLIYYFSLSVFRSNHYA